MAACPPYLFSGLLGEEEEQILDGRTTASPLIEVRWGSEVVTSPRTTTASP